MKSFNGDEKLKVELLAEVVRHREADMVVQGTYGENGGGKWKGCAVGCAIHSLNLLKGSKLSTGDHGVYERELGIPRVIARLEDRIFEGLSVDDSKTFPERFISAIPVGVDLSNVWPKFIVWLLGDEEFGVIRYAKSKSSIAAIKGVLDLYMRKVAGEGIAASEWVAVRADAADAADAAADAAAYAAAYAAAAADAAYASAASAASAAAAAADAYAYAYAAAAADADAAYAYARRKHYARMASKLIEIISNEK